MRDGARRSGVRVLGVGAIVAFLATACAGSDALDGSDDSGVIGVDGGPVVDAGPLPEVRCPSEVDLGELVPAGSTRARVECAISVAPVRLVAVALARGSDPGFAAELADAHADAGDEPGGDRVAIAVTFAAPAAGTAELPLVVRATLTLTFDDARVARELVVRARVVAPIAFDPLPAPPPCRAELAAPLLDETLALTSLDRASFGFTTADLMESSYYAAGDLGDEMLLSWFEDARAHPHRAGCLEGELAGALDVLLATGHPISGAVRHAARLLDRDVADAAPIDPRTAGTDFELALGEVCDLFGCEPASGEMPADLGEALAPLLRAINAGLVARSARNGALSLPHDAEWWTVNGGFGLLLTETRQFYALGDPLDRAYLIGLDRGRVYGAAAQIAYAIEAVAWERFRGRTGVSFDVHTNAGWVHVRDGAAHTYLEDGADVLLLVDLGGDDVHLDDVASNRSAFNAVSIAIDAGGNDRYGYEAHATAFDRPGLLAADDGLRFAGSEQFGNVSLSHHFRQGAARNGIAMLVDLGGGDDRYETLVGGQGYAHQGVGVLFDDGGDDSYAAEAAAQGAAQFGIALLIDGGAGNDTYRAFSYAQGFGYSGGFGVLADGGGRDAYTCDHGDPARGGIPLYFSPQLPGQGNTSMCQGAGFGRRGTMSGEFFSGGVGVLRDQSGDDAYVASVFAQGTGYWQGTGILSDGGGSDRYDAFWYVHGSAAHYSIGVLADSGGSGSDVFNGVLPAYNVHLGAGHDFSVGVLIQDGGDTEYHASQLALGASNCNGVGLFVDNGGDDRYLAASVLSSGVGNTSSECSGDRPNARSIGVMIDAGGRDEYVYPVSTSTVPREGGVWGSAAGGLAAEHGAGRDADGEAGVHAESRR